MVNIIYYQIQPISGDFSQLNISKKFNSLKNSQFFKDFKILIELDLRHFS